MGLNAIRRGPQKLSCTRPKQDLPVGTFGPSLLLQIICLPVFSSLSARSTSSSIFQYPPLSIRFGMVMATIKLWLLALKELEQSWTNADWSSTIGKQHLPNCSVSLLTSFRGYELCFSWSSVLFSMDLTQLHPTERKQVTYIECEMNKENTVKMDMTSESSRTIHSVMPCSWCKQHPSGCLQNGKIRVWCFLEKLHLNFLHFGGIEMDVLHCRVTLYRCWQMATVWRQIIVVQFREWISMYTVATVRRNGLHTNHFTV